MVNKSYLSSIRRLGDVPSFVKKAVEDIKYQQRVTALRKRGAIPLSEIKKDFEKISWDIYRRVEEPNYGSIWKKETIKNSNGEDEDWIVIYTDGDNDRIIRQVKASKKIADTVTIEEIDLGDGKKITVDYNDFDNMYRAFLTNEFGITESAATRNTKDEIYKWVEERKTELKKTSSSKTSKTSHFPGTIVQIDVPHGNLYEKYNGKIGEVVAAVPDRSKVSFKDLPSTWFEDVMIRPTSLCPICNAKISLQMLKKLGTIKCKCGASYSKRKLEKIANENRINKVAAKKVEKISSRYTRLTSTDEQEESVRVVEKAAEIAGHPLVGGTTIGKSPQSVILDLTYQGGQIHIDSEGNIKVFSEDATGYDEESIAKFIKKHMEEPGKEASVKKARIEERNGEYCVIAESGRSMGCYPSHKKAEERLQQVEMFKHMKGKKAQNVIFWFDSPNALKALRHLQGPPISPAKEPSEETEDLEEVELSGEEKVEKEASIKKEAVEIPIEKVVEHIKEDFPGFYETYKIRETTPSKDLDRSLRDWLDSENYIVTEEEFHQILESLFPEELRKETSIKKRAQDEEEEEEILPWEERLKKYRDEAYEYFSRLNWVPDSEDVLGYVIDCVEDESGVDVDPDTERSIMKILGLKIEAHKVKNIKKKADGGMEALRGGGGSSSDKLTPMNWTIQKSKTPKLPEKPEEEEPTEEVEEIHVVVNPDTREVNVSFGDEEGEQIEEEKEEPIGAGAPTTEEPETEEVSEGEESEEGSTEPRTPVIF